MTAEQILAKCGLTADEVSRIASKNRTIRVTADEYEERYANVPDVRDELIRKKYSGNTYGEIAAGTDNGTCTTRRGTYRHLKRQ